MNITIKDNNIEIKQTLRSLLLFENIAGHSYNANGMNDIILFVYCVIVASGKLYDLTYDEYLDWADENPDTLTKLINFIHKVDETQDALKKS